MFTVAKVPVMPPVAWMTPVIVPVPDKPERSRFNTELPPRVMAPVVLNWS